jgi:hypothetical protein
MPLTGDDFTVEELETLGEEPAEGTPAPEPEPAEDPKEDPKEEEQKAEATPEPEPVPEPAPEVKENMVPQSRFDEVYGKSKTYQEKLDLLKQDPEEYYRRYPDEKPQPTAAPPAEPEAENYGDLKVKGGQYDGWTLNEVYAESPADANALLYDYKEAKKAERQQAAAAEAQRTAKETELRQKADAEITSFNDARSAELFGKPIAQLNQPEIDKLNGLLDSITRWMLETGRGGGILEDAYALYQLEQLKAQKGASEKFVKKASDVVPSVGNGGEGAPATGYEAYMSMSQDALAAKIGGMSEREYAQFVKNAPPELKKKYPGFEW